MIELSQANDRAPLVHQLLERSAQRRPEQTLVVAIDRALTYGEVEETSNRIAHALLAQGVQRGDRVALLADNSPAYIQAYYGILKAGAVVVSLNAQGKVRTQFDILCDCSPRGLVCGSTQANRVGPLQDVPGLEFVLSFDHGSPPDPTGSCRWLNGPEELPGVSPDPPRLPLADTDRAAIVYTSGSTGKPRGAILQHRNLVANTESIVQYLELTPADRVLVILPFPYVYGKSLLNTHVAVGGTVILENRMMFPQEALNTLEREGATGLAGVPSTFSILLNKSNLARRTLDSLRYVTQAGGAMAPRLQSRLIEALPGKRIYIMYGATEAAARLSYLPPEDLTARLGSIGKAIPGVELRILRDDGSEAGESEVGELVARGPNIMEGYWNAPEETAEVLSEHGYHTGDLGWRDADGYFFLVGRKREMIKSGAHRISPKEIEEVLVQHAAVHEAAVVGRQDEVLGEAICAYVSLRSGSADPGVDGIIEWCRARLDGFKVPHSLDILRDLPHQSTGKIDKMSLARRAAKSD